MSLQCPHCPRKCGSENSLRAHVSKGHPLRPGSERMMQEIEEAERKALESLGKYKFAMFGYWAGIWVHLNRISGANKRSPFSELVKKARELHGSACPVEAELRS